jgi:phosphate transport system substrate-binding protein
MYTKTKFATLLASGALLLAMGLTSCNGNGKAGGNDSTGSTDDNTLLGAGSTFIYPLFSKEFAVYDSINNLKVNYQSIGSGGGIQQLIAKTVDFGDSDAPLNDEQTTKMGAPALHIPMCSGAVVLSYNLPDLKDTLKLTPAIISDLFLGKITKWNDKEIAAANPGVKLPDVAVAIAHRTDGSGTTNIFTTYLTQVSPEWTTKVGKGSSVNWPVGLGGKGNPGVAGLIQQTPGAIGYIELAYAVNNKMAYAKVQNKSGNFITPTVASTSAAGNIQLPADSKVSISNTDAPDGYPLASFTWALIYKEQNYNGRSLDRATKLLKLLWWTTHDGQQYATALNYAPLPPAAVTVAETILKSATYDGKPILP